MQIFISWSGERSRRLALALKDWIPYVIHPIRGQDIWVSDRDIEPGKRWDRALSDVLAETRIGLICLTHENRQSPWLHFEAGALAKQLQQAKVIPILYGMQPEDLGGGPLAQFQAVRLVEHDVLKMIQSLNSELGDQKVPESVLARSLDHNWPDLEARLRELEEIKVEEMDETLPGVIEAFSKKGLAEPHPGRIVHFEEGFESHALYNIIAEMTSRRLLILGRKNRKLFDKEHRDFLDTLPRLVAAGFDFRCLFLSPDAPKDVLRAAHGDDDFRRQLQACIEKAKTCLTTRGLLPENHFRLYATHRTMNLVIVDDAALFAPIEVAADGRARPLTKCGFSAVDCRLAMGRYLLKTFTGAWEDAGPVE